MDSRSACYLASMTKHLFVIAICAALATIAVGEFAPQHHQQQWQLPSDARAALPIQEHHPHHKLVTSSNTHVWSLSSKLSHQRPFPLRPPSSSQATETVVSDQRAQAGFINDPAPAPLAANANSADLEWSLSNANGSIRVNALFPSLAHLDLLRAGIIQDPSIGFNEGLYRWVADEPSWTYTADLEPVVQQIRATRNLAITANPQQQYWIYFEGLDTIAKVFVGGHLVGATHNQFKWHAFRVPSHLLDPDDTTTRHARNTNITLVFENVNEYAAQQAAEHDPGYLNQVESPREPRTSDYEYPNRIFVRKQQSDFGWDWGPALMPRGPYRPAYLIALPASVQSSDAVAAPINTHKAATSRASSYTQQSPAVLVIASAIDIYRKGQTNNLPPPDPDANWIINVTLTLLSSDVVHWPSIRLAIPSLGLYTFDALLSSPTVQAGVNQPVHAAFEIPSGGKYGPKLWWPRGYGEQNLYHVVIRSDQLRIEVRKRVGFRTAVLDLSDISRQEVNQGVQPGSHFRLFVNQREVYVMGTNTIPLDTLTPRINPNYLRWLLESALQANTNLIRIWGGGAYPAQELLDLCDELGIMVWMDAIFAASLYPYHQEFLREVSGEIAQVMVEVVSHPSLVAVVGNNEGELYFLGAYGTRPQDPEWLRGYQLLFDLVIRDRVKEFSRGLSYLPSSTTTGYLQLDPYQGRYDNYTRGVEIHGTGEHYGYDAQRAFDINTYPRSRFMVEFGMFSLPSIYTLDRILAPLGINDEIYSVNSTVLRAHLKHPPAANLTYPFSADVGQRELLSAVNTYFPQPLASLDAREELHQYSLSSQLYQAIFMANQISVYRRQAGRREQNRGLVVWQLNDIWEGTSWSSIEYTGRWKMAHYVYANVQAPLVAVAVYNVSDDTLELDVVYTGAKIGAGEGEVSVRMDWFDFVGKPLYQRRENVTLDVTTPGSMTISTIRNPARSVCTSSNGCYLRLSSGRSGSDWTWYWTPLRNLTATLRHLEEENVRPQLRLSLVSTSQKSTAEGGHWTVEVRNTGNATAPFVFVDHGAHYLGYFATCQGDGECRPHNVFWLNPGESRTLSFVRLIPSEDARVEWEDTEEQRKKWFDSLSAWSLFDNLGGKASSRKTMQNTRTKLGDDASMRI